MKSEHSLNFITGLIRFCLENKLLVVLSVLILIAAGVMVAPFDWHVSWLPRYPVAVDAIPDIGENQQIVFAEWPGRSPQDVEDQVTYPLTTALLGVPKVKTIRAFSMFGFASVYVIFDEKADFYWCRSRVLEKLASLPAGLLPEGVQPSLGPDATPLGQVFWYTLEGRDSDGRPTGGWGLDELRSIQDWQVRYALQSAEGVSEVASIGGYVREYQVDADPDAMRAYRVTLEELVDAVRQSNLDVGASVMEINRVEYAVRGVGFIKSLADIENAVIKVIDHVPIQVRHVARVTIGPELRRGALDKEGAEVVGGVVVVRYGENPLAVIKNVKAKIAEISSSLPQKKLPDGTISKVTIVPFYDRTGLIYETLGTLNTAIYQQVLVTTIVILFIVRHFASSLLISSVMPLAVLCTFLAMKGFRVDANIVSLSGIAIAIGTVVDMSIIMCENIRAHLGSSAAVGKSASETVYRAASEVGSAVLTAIATTVVGFLPVFAMDGPEGKLFKPLAFTKTFALIASVVIALTVIPALAQVLFTLRWRRPVVQKWYGAVLAVVGLAIATSVTAWGGVIIVAAGGLLIAQGILPASLRGKLEYAAEWATGILVVTLLTVYWSPLGYYQGFWRNLVWVGGVMAALLGFYVAFLRYYDRILAWCLEHKRLFLTGPIVLVLWGIIIWVGAPRLLGWLPAGIRSSRVVSFMAHKFPGLGREFMPSLDEGSYLYMPTLMPHASLTEALDVLQKQDRAFRAIPEVEQVVGKIGRAESALDPAPISMIETVITYKPPYLTDEKGRRLSFRFAADETDWVRDPQGRELRAPDGQPYRVKGKFLRDENGRLIPDTRGKPFPLWRPPLDPALNPGRAPWPGIRKPDDIWTEIVRVGEMPGVTSAPRLQPIAARVVMLQSGMRAAMGVKVYGPDLAAVEAAALELEAALKKVPVIAPETVVADRVAGKPYLEIIPDRQALARYGIKVEDFQRLVEAAIGGQRVTMTVEGRERYPVRVRYLRELRDSIEALQRILVPAEAGTQIPLVQVADIRYARGPDMLKSEDGHLVGYVLFDRRPEFAEVEVVEQARTYLSQLQAAGELRLPGGVRYVFAGNYENQIRAQKKLSVVIPLSLVVIFVLLYLQFRNVPISLFVFSGIVVAWAGGFVFLWLYGQPWFLDFAIFGVNMRELFQIHPIHLSVAIWVGFLALFGIASDDGVVMCTYLNQTFSQAALASVSEIRGAVRAAARRRVGPCVMTTATTVLALLPVLTSTGRGADIMVPMAIPSFGGMLIEVVTMLVAPVLYAAYHERKWRKHNKTM